MSSKKQTSNESQKTVRSDTDEDIDFLLDLALELCRSSITWIYYFDHQKQRIKSKNEVNHDLLSKLPVLFHEILREGEIENITEDLRFEKHFTYLKDLRIGSYFSIPLQSKTGEVLGVFSMVSEKPRRLSNQQKKHFYGLSRQIINLLELGNRNNEASIISADNQLFGSSKGGVFYSCGDSASRNVSSVSDSIRELTGYSKEEFIKDPSRGLNSLIYEEDLKRVEKELQNSIKTQQGWSLTYRIKTSDRSIKWIKDIGTFKASEKQSALEGFLLDITHEIEKDEFYQTVFDYSDSIICIHRKDGQLTHFNKAAADSLGYEMEKDQIDSIYQFIRDEDAKYMDYYFEELRKNSKLTITLRLKSKINESVYWACRVAKIDISNQDSYLISAWDISNRIRTEKKLQESENLFKIISENLSDVLYIYEPATNSYEYISPNTKEVIGVERDYFTSKNTFIEDFVLEDYKDHCKTLKNNLIKGEGYLYEFPIKINNTVRWLNESLHPVKNTNTSNLKFAGRVTNITQRKRDYIELANTKSILEETGRIASVGAWSYDIYSGEVFWSKVTREIHECQEDFIPNIENGLAFYTVGPNRDLVKKKFESLVQDGKPFDVEAEIISEKGNKKWVRVVGKPEFLNGSVHKVTGIFQDITNRKQRTAELERNRLILKSIFNELSDVIWSFSYPDFKLLFVSPSYQTLTGFSISNSDKIALEWRKLIHPDDVANFPKIKKVLKKDDGYTLIYRIITRSKEIKWVRDSGRMIYNEDGVAIRVDGKITDISKEISIQDSMNSQLKLQNILMRIATDYINLGVHESQEEIKNSLKLIGEFADVDRAYIFDYDWEKGTCSNTFEWCAQGINPEIENLQDVPLEYVPQWVETHRRKEFMYIENVDSLEDDELKEILSQQSIQSLIAIPIFFEDQIYGFVGFDYVRVVRDLSEQEVALLLLFAKILANLKNRTVLERDLIQEKERAELNSKYKSEFLANMSHEIRTPLNGVIGFTDLLLKTHLNAIQRQYAENVNISGKSLLGIISDILDFSKIEAGKLELDLIDHSIHEIINSAIDITKFAATQKQIELICDAPPTLPSIINLDPVRLKQVLINLLGNAVKFTERGEVELKVAFKKISENRGFLSFAIRDTGIGISEEQQKKLFNAFSQADSSTVRKYGGTGLGLTISNLLVNKMGGDIKLESSPGMGSVFSFEFETSYKELNGVTKPKISYKKVLLLDDNERNITVLEENLKFWKVPFVSTTSPTSALEILKEDKDIDLAIIDYHMPIMDGVEFIIKTRNELNINKEILKIILLHSSMESDSLQNIFSQFGVSHGLLKPVKSDELYYFLANGESEVPASKSGPSDEKSNNTSENIYNILVAEDIIINMVLIKTLIQQKLPKATIFECNNGEIAVKTYKGQSIDLIFMDVQMPVMDGLTATRKIREFESISGNKTPIVALTAGALVEEKEKCLNAGMDEFLVKPVQSEILNKIIEKYLFKIEEKEEVSPSPTKDEIPIFDKNQLFELINYDMALFKSLMEASLSLESQINNLTDAAKRLDKKTIKSVAHGIKGSCQSMYFLALLEVVRELELEVLNLQEKEINEKINIAQSRWEDLKAVILLEIEKI